MKKTIRQILCCILTLVMVIAMVFAFVACDDPSDDPNGPNDNQSCDCSNCNCESCPDCDCEDCTCNKDEGPVTYKVTVISIKTWTKNIESGKTLEEYKSELNLNPTKSGEKFIGWYEDGATTAFDWATPITKDTTIRARFEKIEGLTVKNGTAFPTEDNGFSTGSANTLFTYGSFEKGSFTVNVTPNKEGNDCGVIFGAEDSQTGKWEDFSYYTLLINKDGVMLLAKMPWSEVCPGVALNSVGITYSKDATYKITVKYTGNPDNYLECYVNDKLVMSTVLENGFYGNVVGCRAAVDGTVFSEITFDENDIPTAPSTDVGGYIVRNGQIEANEGIIKTTQGSTLAIAKDKAMGKIISYTMKRVDATGDDGIVFALTDNDSSSYWEAEGTSYYFLFVDGGSNVRLSKVVGSWNEEGRGNVHVEPQNGEYHFDVITIGNELRMFVNGVQCFTIENSLEGTSYGIRAKFANVEYVENNVSNKVAVIIEGGKTELQLIDSGSKLSTIKPEDPSKDGYEFKGWVKAGTTEAFDWDANASVNAVVSANFEKVEGAKYFTTNGALESGDMGYKTTANDTLFILNNKQFNGGSVEVTMKHNDKTANDIAFIFGANVIDGATWENFDYYVAMINLNGTILFAKVNSWGVLASSPILEENYDATQAYSLKIFYTDGYVRIYAKADKADADYTLALTSYIGELKGSSIGFRAQKACTEFGSTVTIDTNDNLSITTNSSVELEARCGNVSVDENGVFSTTGDGNGNYLAVSKTTLSAGGCITVKMKRVSGDTGVIFGFSGTESWEGSNIYNMLFIDKNGSVRVASFPWHQWHETFEALKDSATEEHTLTISYDGSGVVCFVDGIMYAMTDTVKPNGDLLFGIRGVSGATYSNWAIVDYAQITDSISNSAE